jgi:hypothetical protein
MTAGRCGMAALMLRTAVVITYSNNSAKPADAMMCWMVMMITDAFSRHDKVAAPRRPRQHSLAKQVWPLVC